MKSLIALCSALALVGASACAAAQDNPAPAAAAAAAECSASAEAQWARPGADSFDVAAFSQGPSCQQAAVFLVVRDGAGDIVWSHAAAAAHLFGVNEAGNSAEMSAALSDWASHAAQWPQTTADLPEWEAGADAPGGEFPFYPEQWIDRDAYVELRAKAEPMYCYVQGMESMACLTVYFDRLEQIGVQSFPG